MLLSVRAACFVTMVTPQSLILWYSDPDRQSAVADVSHRLCAVHPNISDMTNLLAGLPGCLFKKASER